MSEDKSHWTVRAGLTITLHPQATFAGEGGAPVRDDKARPFIRRWKPPIWVTRWWRCTKYFRRIAPELTWKSEDYGHLASHENFAR